MYTYFTVYYACTFMYCDAQVNIYLFQFCRHAPVKRWACSDPDWIRCSLTTKLEYGFILTIRYIFKR